MSVVDPCKNIGKGNTATEICSMVYFLQDVVVHGREPVTIAVETQHVTLRCVKNFAPLDGPL